MKPRIRIKIRVRENGIEQHFVWVNGRQIGEICRMAPSKWGIGTPENHKLSEYGCYYQRRSVAVKKLLED